jgi:hypothetical protein
MMYHSCFFLHVYRWMLRPKCEWPKDLLELVSDPDDFYAQKYLLAATEGDRLRRQGLQKLACLFIDIDFILD